MPLRKMPLNDSFEGYTDEEITKYLKEECNIQIWKRLVDGTISAVKPLLYTVSICNDVRPITPFVYRWCFEDVEEARLFYKSLTSFDDIPKHTNSLKGHRYTTKPLLIKYDEMGFPLW